MEGDEYDKYLSEDDGEPKPEEAQTLTQEIVTAVCLALQVSIIDSMIGINQLVITVTRARVDGPVIWGATLRGVTVMTDSLENLVETLNRIR